jgi:hypothetical protein
VNSVTLGRVISVLMVAALFNRSVRQILVEVFVHLRDGLQAGREILARARATTRGWIGSTLGRLGIGGEAWKPTFAIGASVATALFVVFVLADYLPVSLSIDALLGVKSEPPAWLSSYLDIVLGVSVILPAVFAGWCLAELSSGGRLLPVARLSKGERISAYCVSTTVLVTSLAIGVALGINRADVVTAAISVSPGSADNVRGAVAPDSTGAASSLALDMLGSEDAGGAMPPTKSTRPVAFIAIVGLSITLLLSALLAWEAGASLGFQLLPPAIATVVIVLLMVGEQLLRVIRGLVVWIWAIFFAVLNLGLRLGIVLVRLPVSALRACRDWSAHTLRQHDVDQTGTPRQPHGGAMMALATLVAVISSFVDDFELPVDGVGDRNTIDREEAAPVTGDRPGSDAPGSAPPAPSAQEISPADAQGGAQTRNAAADNPTATHAEPDRVTASFAGNSDDDAQLWDPYPTTTIDPQTDHVGATP